MKRSFNQRFVEGSEIDEVRHRHGKNFDDSLVSSAVKRVKEGRA